MASEEMPPGPGEDIPEDAIVFRQVPYAWLYSSLPWLVILGVIFYTDFLIEAFPIVGAASSLIILVPRYLAWRRTAYILTKDALVYQRGDLTGSRKYSIPISKLKDAKAKYGNFGRSLGYQTVQLILDDGNVASLTYLPALEDVAGQLRKLIDESGHLALEPDEGQPSGEGSASTAQKSPEGGPPPGEDGPADEEPSAG